MKKDTKKVRSILVKYFICSAILFFPLTQYGQNLILNPDCEDALVNNEIPEWTEVVATTWGTGGINPTPQSGSSYFYAGQNANAELAQSVDVSSYATTIDNNVQPFQFDGYVRNYTGRDLSRFIIEYRDVSNAVLATFDSGYLDSFGAWLLVSDTKTAPVGTRIIRVRLLSKRESGSNNDGYFDNLSLTAVAPLPVELISFEARNDKNNTVLDWQTASEENNYGFDIERSSDGIHFEKIGFTEGNGTTLESQNYTFIDEMPNNGINYYRLRQIDFDEQFEHSNIISIEHSQELQLNQNSNIQYQVYPNPATDFITIKTNQIGEVVQIIDINGRVLNEFQLQETSNKYSVNSLSNGIYFLKIGKTVKKIIVH